MKSANEKIGIGGYSPVSYFESGPETGKPEFAHTHSGTIYYLTSQEQLNKFRLNPEKYLPAFDGFCAFGHAIEKEFAVDPTSYKIVDGRLLLFLKNQEVDALKLWNEGNERELLMKAAHHFSKSAA